MHKVAPLFLQSEGICQSTDNLNGFLSCIHDECANCKISKKFTFDYLKNFFKIDLNPDDILKVYAYEQKKQNSNSTRSQTEFINKKVKLKECLPSLGSIMGKYKFHYFCLMLQNKAISKLIKVDYNIPPNTLVIFADYSENVGQKMACVDGTQSQYRSTLSFSLLNFVCFYTEDVFDKQTDEFLRRETIRFDFHAISSDIQKDNLLFMKSLRILLERLMKKKYFFYSLQV